MTETDIERARALAIELVQICDRLGTPVAGNYIQMGIDLIPELQSEQVLREEPKPWKSE